MDWSRFYADPYWEALGLLGQLIFGCRFLYQWLVSEKAGRSLVPVGFWWLSLLGTGLIFAYALHEASLTFTVPTLVGAPVYIRNLILIRRERRARG
jgi:lipid-A-disaccharide synthase-like uncharacterized protein